jgi:hypothetical protein
LSDRRESKDQDRVERERSHSRNRKANPGNRSDDPEPHHALSNPATDPDPTEWPDPYDRREDPRDPEGPDNPAQPSTSEPHPPDHDDVKPQKGSE